jgi:hypothetical protein
MLSYTFYSRPEYVFHISVSLDSLSSKSRIQRRIYQTCVRYSGGLVQLKQAGIPNVVSLFRQPISKNAAADVILMPNLFRLRGDKTGLDYHLDKIRALTAVRFLRAGNHF